MLNKLHKSRIKALWQDYKTQLATQKENSSSAAVTEAAQLKATRIQYEELKQENVALHEETSSEQ